MPSESGSLQEWIGAAGTPAGRLHGAHGHLSLDGLARGTSLGGRIEELRGRNIVVDVRDQLAGALALLELDGVARRMVLCPPDVPPAHLCAVAATAQAEAWVTDGPPPPADAPGSSRWVRAVDHLVPGAPAHRQSERTQWILLTSGTTGVPKLVEHSLGSLTNAFNRGPQASDAHTVWSTFYDIRRYGGLQIFLRALRAGSLVLSEPKEDVGDYLARAAAAGVSHISGTPSHWRRALMSGAAPTIAPRYVRLSGEIADQGILDALKAAYPQATVAHAFASTEAGVAFEVRDGLAGFPAALLGATAPAELRIAEGTLRVRSQGTATRYLGAEAEPLRAGDGFVDTGDRLEEHGGRYYFMGRRGGVINVGGQKVHPEEVEAVINAHPWVSMSLVRPRRNAITGAIVAADVVLAAAAEAGGPRPAAEELARELTERCRRVLAPYKVPALIRIVPALEVSASGKLVRPLA